MVQQNADTIKSIIEIGTATMLFFSISVIAIVYILHGRIVKEKF